MGVTYANRPTLDPAQELANCLRLGTPADHWRGKCNRFACPSGVLSGSGMVLMLRRDLDLIDQNTPQTLEFTDATTRHALQNIHIVRALCVSPGAPADPNAVYAVELADKRRRLALSACNLGFNLRSTPGGNYTAASAASTTLAYTWAQIWGYIWATLPADVAGSAPALPATPQGTPEGFDFYGVSSMDAVGQFLARLGWDLVLDPVADTFTVVAIGDTQPNFAAAETRHVARRLYDLEPVEPAYGTIPASLLIQFPRQPVTYGASPYETKTATPSGGALTGEAGTLILFDDLVANYSTGTLSNDAALTARAAARATEFYRVARAARTLCRVYSGLVADFVVGSEVRCVTWADAGREGVGDAWGGVTTTIDRWPPGGDSSEWAGNQPQGRWTNGPDAAYGVSGIVNTSDQYLGEGNKYVRTIRATNTISGISGATYTEYGENVIRCGILTFDTGGGSNYTFQIWPNSLSVNTGSTLYNGLTGYVGSGGTYCVGGLVVSYNSALDAYSGSQVTGTVAAGNVGGVQAGGGDTITFGTFTR